MGSARFNRLASPTKPEQTASLMPQIGRRTHLRPLKPGSLNGERSYTPGSPQFQFPGPPPLPPRLSGSRFPSVNWRRSTMTSTASSLPPGRRFCSLSRTRTTPSCLARGGGCAPPSWPVAVRTRCVLRPDGRRCFGYCTPHCKGTVVSRYGSSWEGFGVRRPAATLRRLLGTLSERL